MAMEASNDEASRWISTAICNLTHSAAGQQFFCDEGIRTGLSIMAMEASNDEARRWISTAICNLTHSAAGQQFFCDEGIRTGQ